MGKRVSLFIVIFVVCALLCSCAASSRSPLPDTGGSDILVSDSQPSTRNTNGIALDINDGIYDLSSCLPGFWPTAGSNYYSYQLNDIHLYLSIYNKSMPMEALDPGGNASFQKRSENGMEYYYYRSGTVAWDGVDEAGKAISGETISCKIIFYVDQYIIVLFADTGEEDISAVTFQLAMKLLSKAPIKGLEQRGGGLSARFQNGSLECNISLIPKNDAGYQNVFHADGATILEEGGIRYLTNARERSQDDPNSRFIICDTDKGALVVSCGVPYSQRNNVSADKLDFINLSLAQSIAQRLGVVIHGINK